MWWRTFIKRNFTLSSPHLSSADDCLPPSRTKFTKGLLSHIPQRMHWGNAFLQFTDSFQLLKILSRSAYKRSHSIRIKLDWTSSISCVHWSMQCLPTGKYCSSFGSLLFHLKRRDHANLLRLSGEQTKSSNKVVQWLKQWLNGSHSQPLAHHSRCRNRFKNQVSN